MPDKAKLPIVAYRIRGFPLDSGFGYLLERDGQVWCFPNEEEAQTQAFPSGGFQLDRSQLREQHDKGADRKFYQYLKDVEGPHEATQTLPQGTALGQSQVR